MKRAILPLGLLTATLSLTCGLVAAPAAQDRPDQLFKEWSYPGASQDAGGGGSGGGSSGGTRATQLGGFIVRDTPEKVWGFYFLKASASDPRRPEPPPWGTPSGMSRGRPDAAVSTAQTEASGTILYTTPGRSICVTIAPAPGGRTRVWLLLHAP
jgi:hypothetical protein